MMAANKPVARWGAGQEGSEQPSLDPTHHQQIKQRNPGPGLQPKERGRGWSQRGAQRGIRTGHWSSWEGPSLESASHGFAVSSIPVLFCPRNPGHTPLRMHRMHKMVLSGAKSHGKLLLPVLIIQRESLCLVLVVFKTSHQLFLTERD